MPWIFHCPALAAPAKALRIIGCALLLTACASLAPRESRPVADTVILISIDGLPADVVGTGTMPALDAIANDGVRATWMNPSFPTLTFPNHYTLVTGLRPDRHGIVHNYMSDPALGDFVSKEASAQDGRWWGGEPIWATLQKQGGTAATMFWPGSEALIAGQRPHYMRRFDNAVTTDQRVDQLLAWLDLPPSQRPRLMLAYFNQFDVASHAAGMRSDQARDAVRTIDAALSRLREGLRERGMLGRTDLLVISDHGMIDVPYAHVEMLDDTLDSRHYRDRWYGPVVALEAVPGSEEVVAKAFIGRHSHYTCWDKASLPPAWHFGRNARIPPIVCQTDTGWRVQSRRRPYNEPPIKGEHGFAPEDPSMRAVFVADGPSFRDGATIPDFDNVHLYPLLARLLRVTPAASDGDLSATGAALR